MTRTALEPRSAVPAMNYVPVIHLASTLRVTKPVKPQTQKASRLKLNELERGSHAVKRLVRLFLIAGLVGAAPFTLAQESGTLAVIGTGDMGNSLGPKLSALGYQVIYGSRDPARKSVQQLVELTGNGASATTQEAAAQSADIVLLAVGWPAMEQVAQNLGNLDGKIVIDVSTTHQQGEDGYPESMVETSGSEMIQAWNPGAIVVKWGLPTAQYIDAPQELGRRPSNWIASDNREAKETVARMAYAIGQDPIDAGPLRMSQAIEGQVLLFMVPLYQRRTANWESIVARTSYWSCVWEEDWSVPVFDAENLAEFPEDDQPLKACSEFPSNR